MNNRHSRANATEDSSLAQADLIHTLGLHLSLGRYQAVDLLRNLISRDMFVFKRMRLVP